jgi:hypothetical protein
MPGHKLDALLVVLECLLDHLEQGIRLVLVDSYIVADGENNFTNLLLGAVLVVFLVLV